MTDLSSETKSLKTIFQTFYHVPQYQRDYVWDDEMAVNLLSNILDSMEENQQSYFIGSIVLQEKDYSNYYIVDGQ